MAPEITFRLGPYCKKADIYSLGFIFYYIKNKKYPFKQTINNVESIKTNLQNFHKSIDKN